MNLQRICTVSRLVFRCVAAGFLLWNQSGLSVAGEKAIGQAPRAAPHNLLEVVRGVADARLVHGVDRWGDEHTGMLISLLDRKTLAPFAVMPQAPRGIRSGDRVSLHGANYNTDQNLYQTLYGLSRVTGDPRYAKAADTALAAFLTAASSASFVVTPPGVFLPRRPGGHATNEEMPGRVAQCETAGPAAGRKIPTSPLNLFFSSTTR
ncbi:MAG: hypothetical protein FJ280_01885 [Planctomycetes bacterium]|nr:hypothetical protein [Planctomycetota bacterium]